MNVNPALTSRLESLGRTYQEMHKNTHFMQGEIIKFSETSATHFNKFKEANNQMAELEKMPGISRKALDDRWAVLDALAQKTREFTPLFQELIYNTRPLIDGINKFGDGIYKGYDKLQAAKDNATESERIMKAMENRLALLEADYTTIRHRIDNCKSKMDEINALHNSLLN